MIDNEEKSFLEFSSIVDKDDNGKTYTKSIYYMKDSVRISIETQMRLVYRSKTAQIIYWAIINEMNKNEYEVTVSRNTLKKVTNLSDASISLAIKELTTNKENENDKGYKPLIEIIDKNTYHIPINQCVKGNVNIIIQKDEKLREELSVMEREKEAKNRITEFSLKLRNKPLIKKQSNESKD